MDTAIRIGGLRAHAIWLAASLFYFYEYFVRAAPSVMTSELQAHFSISAAQIATAVGAYYFIYSPMQLLVGTLFDTLGGRRLLIFASVVVGIGCLVAAVPSRSLFFLASGRFFMGLGSAFGFIGVMFLATQWFPQNRLALLSGLTTTLGLLGGICSQAPLTFVVEGIGWQHTWLLAALLGLVITAILAMTIPSHCPTSIASFTDKSQHNFSNFLMGLWLVIKNPQTWLIGFVGACLYMPVVVFADLWGVQYIRVVCGITKAQAAHVVAGLYWGWIVGGPLVGWLSDRWRRRKLLLMLGSLACLALFTILLLVGNISPFTFGLLLFVMGVFSSVEVICFVASLECNSPTAKGSAMAVVNMIIMLVGGFFQPIFGKILDLQYQTHPSVMPGILEYTANDYKVALLALPAMLLLGIFACFFIRESLQGEA